MPDRRDLQSDRASDETSVTKHVRYEKLHDSDSEETSHTGSEQTFADRIVTDYVNSVMPSERTFNEKNSWWDVAMTVLQQHPYTVMLYGASLQETRVLRWTSLVLGTLVNLFVDTLFFSTFFPDTGVCETYTAETDCITPVNSALGTPLCTWKKDKTSVYGGECSLAPPPSDMTFTMILVMLTVMIAVPISFMLDFVLESVCKYRPDFKQWKWNEERVLGRSTQSAATFNRAELDSSVKILRDHFLETKGKEAQYYGGEHLEAYQAEQRHRSVRNLDKVSHLSPQVYVEFGTAESEAVLILEAAKQYMADQAKTADLPWTSTGKVNEAVEFKVRAITSHLGIYSDCSPAPLSVLDQLRYGNAKNKLVHRIEQAREGAENIQAALVELGETEQAAREVALIQFFLSEHFNTFKQYILRGQFFSFSDTSALTVSPTKWVAAWAFIFAMELFFIYWMLQWGVSSGSTAMKSWALNFSIGAIQEIFCIAPLRVVILYLVAMNAINPQLRHIHRVLHRIAMDYVQDRLPDNYSEIKVVQHFSPACRAARKHVSLDLAAGEILRALDDCDVDECQRGANASLSTIAVMFVAIPILVGVLTETGGEVALDTALPSFLSMVILAHYLAYQTSIFVLILPYAALAAYFFASRYLTEPAIRRVQAIREGRSRRQHGVAHSVMNRWITARRNKSIAVLLWYKLSNSLLDTGAMIVYYLGFTRLFGNAVERLRKDPNEETTKLWKTMNIPAVLQGYAGAHVVPAHQARIEAPRISAKMSRHDLLRAEKVRAEQLLATLPRRVQKMVACKDWLDKWHLDEADEMDYFTAMLNTKLFNMQPAGATAGVETTSSALAVSVSTPVFSSEEVHRFRHLHGFSTEVDSVLLHILGSYRQQVLDRKLYHLSLLDEQNLTNATTVQELAQFDGSVHVRDLAMMLGDLLHFFRPFGRALSAQARRYIVARYDKWVALNCFDVPVFVTQRESGAVEAMKTHTEGAHHEHRGPSSTGYYEPCAFAYRTVRDFGADVHPRAKPTVATDSSSIVSHAHSHDRTAYVTSFVDICAVLLAESAPDSEYRQFVSALPDELEKVQSAPLHRIAHCAVSFGAFCQWFLELSQQLLPKIAKDIRESAIRAQMEAQQAKQERRDGRVKKKANASADAAVGAGVAALPATNTSAAPLVKQSSSTGSRGSSDKSSDSPLMKSKSSGTS